MGDKGVEPPATSQVRIIDIGCRIVQRFQLCQLQDRSWIAAEFRGAVAVGAAVGDRLGPPQSQRNLPSVQELTPLQLSVFPTLTCVPLSLAVYSSEEIALRIVAHARVSSEPIQHRDVETCIWRINGSMNRIVTTPAKDPIGFTRPLPTGFWVATDDINNTHPPWFRTESDARLYLANLFLIELRITTGRGSSSYRVVSKKSSRGTQKHPSLELDWCNWAEFGTGMLWLKLWDSHHGLLPGDQIEVSTDVDDTNRNPVPDLYWRGRVADVVAQDVFVTDARRLFRPS